MILNAVNMPDYKQAKIYKITNSVSDKCYVGYTTQSLTNRFCAHKSEYLTRRTANITLNKLFQNNFDDVKISLVEDFSCDTKKDLLLRRQYWIETLDCGNKQTPLQTDLEKSIKRKEYHKKYQDANRERILAQKREYYNKNLDKIRAYKKQYAQRNRDKKKLYNIKYREANLETIKNKLKQKIECECGALISRSNISLHRKTKKHINLMQENHANPI